MQQSIQIKVEAFGAIEKLLPENLLLVCPSHSLVKDVLDEIVLLLRNLQKPWKNVHVRLVIMS
ncbi:ThiS family protein [Acinetobacter baumannii]|nr:ThiS family protein [Acinetobacter baumannii]